MNSRQFVKCVKRQNRLKFSETRSRAKRPLELIHTDVCGPIDPTTWNNKKYFITFLDDYTHYTLVYLLENKYEVQDIIKQYVERVEAHWNSRVSKIRYDNGKEYLNKGIDLWSKQKGIVLDTTIPYTPQHNGRAERLNRTLMDKIRALLFDSHFNKKMWGEALYCSVYVLNRLPTDSLKCTPYEMWEKRKPNIKNLQIFGSIAFEEIGSTKKT